MRTSPQADADLRSVPVQFFSPHRIYYGLSWVAVISCFVTLGVGLWNADLVRSEKGFYAMAYGLGLFGAITVQKNIRDAAAFDNQRRPAVTAAAPRPVAPAPPAAPRP